VGQTIWEDAAVERVVAVLTHFLIMMWIGLPEQELPGVVAALSSPLWHDVNLAVGGEKEACTA
jgi:hypothetical protein